MCDNVPEIEGLDAMYGVSVHHCPYCDGYEHRGQPIAVLGKGKAATQLALKLKTWTDDLVVCTNGATEMKPQERDRLAHHRIPIRREHVVRLEGTDGKLEQIVFDRGAPLPRSAIFFTLGQKAGCNLPERLGCRMNKAIVTTDIKERTGIPGLFVAGDASKDVQFVIVAAAEGAKAAVCINEELAAEDGLQDPPSPPTTEEAKAAVVVDPSV